ncbi:hypothetical protein ACCS93_39075 [Rhizobium ruizarguesonis]
MSNNQRRAELLDDLEARVKQELDRKLPDLVSAADVGLRSLDERDELAKIIEMRCDADDLLGHLEGLGMMGDTPQDRPDTHLVARTALLKTMERKIREAIANLKDSADKKLNGSFYQSQLLDDLERRLKSATDYHKLLCDTARAR